MVDTINDLISGLQQYVVAPLNAFGLGGFVFDIGTEDMAVLSADITDHYTEDNRALQDHIAIKPKRITLKGFVGELVFTPPGNGVPATQTVVQKLTEISAFLPVISAAATQAQAAISGVNSANATIQSLAAAVPAAANIYGLVQDAIGATGDTARQQGAYQYFAACQSEAILMGIQTPWEFLTNMAVETIVAIQPEDSIFATDFAITFKQIRIADSESLLVSLLTGTGGTAPTAGTTFQQEVNRLQAAAETNIGTIPGLSTVVSLASPLNNPLGTLFKYAPN